MGIEDPERSLKDVSLKEKEGGIIAVDIREFSAPLPIYLHYRGMKIVAMTLTVGDYVLTDDICVERKCVSTLDLHQSLRSGRL